MYNHPFRLGFYTTTWNRKTSKQGYISFNVNREDKFYYDT